MSKFTFYATSLIMFIIGIASFISLGYTWALGEHCEPGGILIGLIMLFAGTLNLAEGPDDAK
jgi:hypothetical protein